MSRKCIYCGIELTQESLIDFCEKCGIGSFGAKMFNAIIQNMEQANFRGDLEQGGIA